MTGPQRSAAEPLPAVLSLTRLVVDSAGSKIVSQAGGLLLTEAVRTVGLDRALSATLGVAWAGEHALDHDIDPASVTPWSPRP